MAPTTTLPPQAYTREILSKAYLWAQTQPESIRKLAATPDALVGLFLRAQRNGEASLETVAPVSRDNFISDLKSLASELEQFDGPPTGGQFQNVKTVHTQTVTNYVPPAPQPRTVVETVVQPQTHQQQMSPQSTSTELVRSPSSGLNLDSKSLEMIQDVKRQLNLTSDSEVLRLLLVLGFERAKNLFPGK